MRDHQNEVVPAAFLFSERFEQVRNLEASGWTRALKEGRQTAYVTSKSLVEPDVSPGDN